MMNIPTDYSLDVISKCPRCSKAYASKIADISLVEYETDIEFAECHLNFHVEIVLRVRRLTVRAKRSKQNKKNNTRFFSIRVIEENGKEDLIEFEKTGIEDFELRARDQIYLFKVKINSFPSKEPRYKIIPPYRKNSIIIHNITIRNHMEAVEFETLPTAPGGACYFATYLYGESSVEVASLRQYRDDVLMKHKLAKLLVEVYYFLSPKIIANFGNNRIFRRASLILMKPVIFGVKYSQQTVQR